MKKVLFVCIILFTLYLLPYAAASPSAVIQNDSSYVDSVGHYHVVGEVLNTGDAWLKSARITGTLKNSSGLIVDGVTSYAYTLYLGPEARSPFDLIEYDAAKSAKIASYSLTLEFDLPSTPPELNLTIQSLKSSTDSQGNLNLLGQVRNMATGLSDFTKAYATFYDQSGKVIYVDSAYTSPSDIPRNQTATFTIIGPSSNIASHVAAFNVGAESSQYTSVPEFPWATVALVAALALGVVVLGKRRRGSATFVHCDW